MKNILKTLLLLVTIPFIVSCQKEKTKIDEINVTLKNTESYHQTFVLGDEEGATIKVQAQHYEKSEFIRDESTNMNVVYHYKPITDFVGKDYVVIEVCYNKTGVGPTDIQTVKINFTISK